MAVIIGHKFFHFKLLCTRWSPSLVNNHCLSIMTFFLLQRSCHFCMSTLITKSDLRMHPCTNTKHHKKCIKHLRFFFYKNTCCIFAVHQVQFGTKENLKWELGNCSSSMYTGKMITPLLKTCLENDFPRFIGKVFLGVGMRSCWQRQSFQKLLPLKMSFMR